MRVLIIEDEEKTADYLRRGLTEQGYTVESVTTPSGVIHLTFTR